MAEQVSPNPIRFGIMGCAEISRKIARAIDLAPNAAISAIGSRSIDKATRFAAQIGLAPTEVHVYGTYQEVVDDTCVEAVYVPLPTSLHVRWALAAAEKGKHVFLEKPTAVHVRDLERILEACGASGVQFMDGTMWMHHPRTHLLKEVLSDPLVFGQLKSIHSTSTYAGSPEFLENDIRVKPDLDSLGALGDTGWYCIRAILWANNYQLPKSITALSAQFNNDGVIVSCASSMLWNDSKTATFNCSFLSNESMDFNLYGTRGSIRLRDFIIPFQESSASFSLSSGAKFTELHLGWDKKPEEVSVSLPLPQEALMINEFARLCSCIRDSGHCPDLTWSQISQKTQPVLDAVKESIDIGFKLVEL